MELSVFLAKVFGLYFAIMSVTLIVRHESFMANVNAMLDCRGVRCLSAVMTLIIGILLVVSHNIWTFNWTVIITILCWLTFLKGILRLWFPEIDEHWRQTFSTQKVLQITGVITLLVGIFLLVMGFWMY